MIGAFTAAGIPPWFMVAHSRGETFEGLAGPDGRPPGEADRSGGAVFKLHRGVPLPGPGSLKLALTSLAQPMRHTPLGMTVGWLPRGVISTDSLKHIVHRAVPSGWVDHPSFWAVACDYSSGRRVPLGREGIGGRADAPPADLPDAVAASCAIPGFYRPVRIGNRDYVDGGVRSASNLDVLAGLGLDLVICMNPTSTREPRGSGANVLDRVAHATRQAAGRRLGHEAKRVRTGGTDTVLIQPVAEDLLVMGRNLMSGARRNEVIETAQRTVREQLRDAEIARKLEDVPPGEPHKIRMPSGPPSQWPELVPSQRRVA